MLYIKKKNMFPAYIWKYTLIHEKQAILLMIPNEEGWHYLALKKLSALLREITSKHVLFQLSSFA